MIQVFTAGEDHGWEELETRAEGYGLQEHAGTEGMLSQCFQGRGERNTFKGSASFKSGFSDFNDAFRDHQVPQVAASAERAG